MAVPFEEDDRNPKVWFLDHNYHENMFTMFKKVNGTACSSFHLFPQRCACFLIFLYWFLSLSLSSLLFVSPFRSLATLAAESRQPAREW
jgi:hypothetical protein